MAALVLVALGVIAGCGGSSDGGEELSFDGVGHSGVDPANTRFLKGPINRDTVTNLEVAWTVPLTGSGSYGSYASTPVIAKGVVYSQDLESNVQAIALESGEVLWDKRYRDPSHGPNGVAVAEGRVYGATTSAAFALDQETGKEIWSTPLVRNSAEGIDMAPGIDDGLVYVSTVPVTATSTYEGGGVGVLWALDAKTGKKVWNFDTVPRGLWGNPEVNSGGGLWYPPSFDEKGSMYFGTGNPGPLPGTEEHPWGSSRPGPNLYADSMVKLDAKTGEMDWFHQVTPHNLYDWDFQDSPVLARVGGRDLAIGAGKSGIVIAFDADSGKPVWERKVGTHNGHDNDSIHAMRGEYSKIKLGEVFPGQLGGVLAPMAANDTTVFVPVINHSMTLVSPSEITESSTTTSELLAMDMTTGKEKWMAEFQVPLYGAALVVNDLVFVTTVEGTISALDADTGGEVWQGTLPTGTNAGVMVSGDTLVAGAGLPLAEGQQPQIVAYRLGGGE